VYAQSRRISHTFMKSRKAALIFIFITVVLDMLALGLVAPVLPKLVLGFLSNDMKRAADWNGIFLTVFAVMQFFFSPIIGVLSDRVGRRPVLLLSSLGLGLDYMVMALAPSIGWLFLGRIVSGITASSIPTAMAYIADVTPREKRGGAFGLIGAAFGIGFTLGPAIGGLVGNTNPRLAFWVAASFSLLNWLYGFVAVPESLPADQRKQFTWRRANPVGSLVLLRSHPDLWKLASIQFLAYVSHEIFAIWSLYAIYRFGWEPRSIGNSLFFVGVCTALISAGLSGRMVAWIGERRTLHGPVFRGARNGGGRPGLQWRHLHGIHPNHLDVEYFLSRRADDHDTSRKRTRTRRTAGRDQQSPLDRLRHRPIFIFVDLCLVHRPKTLLPRARRRILFGGRASFHRNANGHWHQTTRFLDRETHACFNARSRCCLTRRRHIWKRCADERPIAARRGLAGKSSFFSETRLQPKNPIGGAWGLD
jgi:multidrug resistance protein